MRQVGSIVILALLCLAVACRRNSPLSDDLAWLNNTYNPHPNISDASGHGTTGWYTHARNGGIDALVEGSTETFSNDGCKMTIREKRNPAASSNSEMRAEVVDHFDLQNIDPATIQVKTYSHYGGMNCEQYPQDERDAMNITCDYAEMTAHIRDENPLVSEETHTIWPKLTGAEHDAYGKSRGSEIWFELDDVDYARKFANVFRDAVVQCGGTKGAGSQN